MRRFLGLCVALLLLLPSAAAGAYSTYSPGPSGTLGLALPTLSQEFVLQPGEQILEAQAWIDEQPVQATWTESGRIQFRPTTPLKAGEHTARLRVQVDAGRPGFTYPPKESTWRFTIAPGAVSALPEAPPEARRAQAQLNKIRQGVGLQPLALQDALGAAAQSHADYLHQHVEQYSLNGHGEEAGRPGFTGTNVGARAAYWGWTQGASEVVAVSGRAEEALADWIATLYHRIPLLHPDTVAMGYGWAGADRSGKNVLVSSKSLSGAKTVAYPAAGARTVPPEWNGLETPDPLALYGLADSGPVGYPITLTFGGPVIDLRLTAAQLTGPAGDLELLSYDPAFDPNLSDAVAIIPRQPLQPETTHTVLLKGWIDRGEGPTEFTERWSFTTGWGAPEIERSSRQGNRVTLTGRQFAPAIQLFVGGVALPVERLSSTQLRFTVPSGLGGPAADLLLVNPGGLEGRWLGINLGEATGTSPLQRLPLVIDGRPFETSALDDGHGGIFIPESALAALGGQQSRLYGLDRVDWSWPGRSGEYTWARLQATVDGAPYTLTHPPFWYEGQLWLEAPFAAKLSGEPLTTAAASVTLGRPLPPPTVTGNFTDTQAHWAAAQIRMLAQQGIISGYPDGSFRPEDGLSRAAFIKLISQATGLPLAPGATGAYTDVSGHWVVELGYLGAARTAGILADWQEGRLEPDRPITRTEIAVMLTRALGLEVEAQQRATTWGGKGDWLIGSRSFVDVATWAYRGHVAVAIESGIISGYAAPGGGYSFGPQREATRAEAAVMVARFLDKR